MRFVPTAATLAALLCLSTGARAQDATLQMLRELTDAHGPSGSEGPVGRVVVKYLKPLVDEVRTDGLGSIIGVKRGSAAAPRVMLVAHMDEVGFMVKYIDEDGYVYVTPLGGWLDNVLLAQRWIIMTRDGPVLGITGSKAPHVASEDDRTRMRTWREIFSTSGRAAATTPHARSAFAPATPLRPTAGSPFSTARTCTSPRPGMIAWASG